MIIKLLAAIFSALVLALAGAVVDGKADFSNLRGGDREVVSESRIEAQTTAETAFSEVKLTKVGNHTYYPDTLFDSRYVSEENRKIVFAEMEKADKCLETDVYISGFNQEYMSEYFRLYGYRMTDGIVEPEFSLNTGRGSDGTVSWGSHKYGLLSLLPDAGYVNGDGVRPASEFFAKVYDLAKEHEKQIFRHCKTEPIRGNYMLNADLQGNVFYEFTINAYTTIRVNARTGAVMEEYYWDGVYVD